MLGAQGASVAITIFSQYLLPLIFLFAYGIANYGEWLALSAAISYLGNLNFGITTYSTNELTILRQRSDMDEYRRLQGSTLAFLMLLVAVGAALCAGIGLLPLPSLLHLKSMSRTSAGLTAALLGLLALVHIFFGYFNSLFMVVQETHRGSMWASFRFFAPVLAAIPLALTHSSFAELALFQLLSALLVGVASMFDLRARLRGLPLGPGGANWATLKSALRPGGMFAMVFTQQFLLFQAPILILQRIVGPEIVVLFTICRTILSTARRLLSMLTFSISPEITFSFGSGDTKKLLDIFHSSERVVFSLIPVANLGALLFSPVLLALWLRKPGLFEPWTYALMALVSAAMSMREHKQYFQYSTNRHYGLAHIVFWGNLAMIAASIPMTMRFGLHGMMVTWLVSETTQMALLYRENRKLFSGDASISILPALKLAAFMGIGVLLCLPVIEYARQHSLAAVGAAAAAGTALAFGLSYLLFDLKTVQSRLLARVAGH